jgi:hypothetical protein
MEDWQKEIWQTWTALTEQVEGFWSDVTAEINELTNTVGLLSEEVTSQLIDTTEAIEQSVVDWMMPTIEAILESAGLTDETANPLRQTVEPFIQQHPVCMGCRHYHGQIYGDTMLVCAMHPYGVEAGVDSCPDREANPWLPPINPNQLFFNSEDDEL